VVTPEQYAAYRAAQAAGASIIEAAGVAADLGRVIELDWHDQLRGPDGRWISHPDAAQWAAIDARHAEKQAKPVYTGRQHSYRAGALTVHEGGLAAQRQRAASVTAAQQRAMTIAQTTDIHASDLQRAMVESKIYTASEVAGMQRQIDELKARLDGEDNEKSRGILASHIGMVVAGGLVAAATAGVGLPALLAAGITMTPGIAQELIDFHAVEKGRGRRFLAHPVQETRHAYQALRHKLPPEPTSPLLKPRPPVRPLRPRLPRLQHSPKS
jgi:hypothetical protein